MLVSLFEKILSMSLIGCYVILVVFLIRLLLHKCERKYSFYLWFVVFLNLCIPFSIQGSFSLIPNTWVEMSEELSQAALEGINTSENQFLSETEKQGMLEQPNNQADTFEEQSDNLVEIVNGQPDGFTAGTEALQSDLSVMTGEQTLHLSEGYTVQPDEGVQMSELTDTYEKTADIPIGAAGKQAEFWQMLCSIVWLTVLILLGGISIFRACRLSRHLKGSRSRIELSGEAAVYAEGIKSPFLWGFFKPVIYLPRNVEDEELSYILAHESYHKKRLDYITKPVFLCIACVHWFNPLVWLAYAFFVRDMEISCDEAVLAHSTENIKKQYANSLLKYAARQNGFVLSPLTFGEPSLKARIRNVLQYKKKGVAVTAIAGCLVILVTLGLVLRPESTAQPSVTDLPEASGSQWDSYPQYFQLVLLDRQAGGNMYAESLGIQESIPYSYFPEPEDSVDQAFSQVVDFGEAENYQFHINWIKLDKDTILRDLQFDLKGEILGRGCGEYNSFVNGVYEDEEAQQVYVVVSGLGGGTWVIGFPIDAPEDYRVIADTTENSWFEETVRIGDDICTHNGSGSSPFKINLRTGETRYCEEEKETAEALIQEFADSYVSESGERPHLFWFYAIGQVEDVELYAGYVQEAMDTPTLMHVLVAFRNGEFVDAMFIEEETGEISYTDVLPEKEDEETELSSEEITWFNETFPMSMSEYLAAVAVDSYEDEILRLAPVEGYSYVVNYDSINIYKGDKLCGWIGNHRFYEEGSPATGWLKEADKYVEMDFCGSNGSCRRLIESETEKMDYVKRLVYRREALPYTYADTEWLVQEGIFASEEEALQESQNAYLVFYGRESSCLVYYMRLTEYFVGEEGLKDLLAAVEFKADYTSDGLFKGFFGRIPEYEYTQEDMGRYFSQNIAADITYHISADGLEYDMPEGTVAIQDGEDSWKLYCYSEGKVSLEEIGSILLIQGNDDDTPENIIKDYLQGGYEEAKLKETESGWYYCEEYKQHVFSDTQKELLSARESGESLADDTNSWEKELLLSTEGTLLMVFRRVY